MVQERIGEYMGPVDWSYDFASHFKGCSENYREERCRQAVEWLVTLDANPRDYEATTDGGCPKFGWFKVLRVGMYDGWPYWRPVPAVLLAGPLGTEWKHFDCISGIVRIE